MATYLIEYPWLIDLIGACLIPTALLLAASAIGARWHHPRRGLLTGLLLALLAAATYLYGTYIGARRFVVRHVELSFADLPPAFDGYRIVQLSDLHSGTLTGRRASLLQQAVDSINAVQPDAIVLTGDLVNAVPSELVPHLPTLEHMQAHDGIFAVLGNHDYGMYVPGAAPAARSRMKQELEAMADELGWCMLSNSRRYVRRGNDSIVVAGMENDGEGRFPQLGQIGRALWGVSRQDFVVMLEHDPTSWRRKILPQSHAQLTLSGHTHGGQFSLLSWSPASLAYSEYRGTYHLADGRTLHVSSGLCGVIACRLGCPPEIVVITLRKKP